MSVSLPRPDAELSVGIDYLTCTALASSQVRALLVLGEDLVDQEEQSGGIRKPFHFKGFAGWQAGAASAGFNGSRALVRVSGATARESAKELIGCADNVSRLDVQATVRSDALGVAYAEQLYGDLDGYRRGRGKPLVRKLIKQSDGGGGIYLGSPHSAQYGRIYNKSAEQGERCDVPRWRYEVEFKEEKALAQARSYHHYSDPDAWCGSTVHHWFSDRGACPPFSAVARPTSWGDARGSDAQARRVQWLKVAVRPVVQKLIAQFGPHDVLALLGVDGAYLRQDIKRNYERWEDM